MGWLMNLLTSKSRACRPLGSAVVVPGRFVTVRGLHALRSPRFEHRTGLIEPVLWVG